MPHQCHLEPSKLDQTLHKTCQNICAILNTAYDMHFYNTNETVEQVAVNISVHKYTGSKLRHCLCN